MPLLAGVIQGIVQICNINTPNNMCKNPIRDLKDSYYLSMKTTLNRCVFRTDLKFSKDDTYNTCWQLISESGAATLNAQSPYDLGRVFGMTF